MSDTTGYTFTVYAESLTKEQLALFDDLLLHYADLMNRVVTKDENVHYLGYVQDDTEPVLVRPWGLDVLNQELENTDEQIE